MWGLRQDEHKVYLGIKDVWRGEILEAYNRSWLDEIKDEVIDFTHKLAKDMLDHIKKQRLSITGVAP